MPTLLRIVYNHGLKDNELRMAVETCKIYKEQFIAEWYARFDD